ncbi:MAG: type II toxin-antitoxin system Phd/YefM family antitoxin [Opitutales bacterium]
MKTATISEAKNKLSELLVAVQAGETLTILDRKRPIARVEAIREVSGNPHVSAPRAAWDPEKFIALPLGEMFGSASGVVDAVAEERESGW